MPEEKRRHEPVATRLDDLVDAVWEESTRIETVLVVHGYGSLREALVRTLEYYGYRALEASTREQALRVVRCEQADLLLLDFDLGDNDGPALAAEIAKRVETRHIPVLALSSDLVSRDALRLHGFRGSLVMPVEQKDLLAAIDRALEPMRRRVRAELRLEPADEQCRLPLEDRLRSEHLSLFFRFPTATRIDLRTVGEPPIAGISARLGSLGIQPDIRLDGSDLLLLYDLTIADAFALGSAEPVDEIMLALLNAFPELATRPDALRARIATLSAEYQRLQRVAS